MNAAINNGASGYDWCGNVGTCLSTGAIVGIVIGSVAGVAIIIGIIIYIRRKKAR
jgi:Na+/phosphate symporter